MMRVVDQETETKKGVEALLMRIIESALFKSENNHVQETLHKKILIYSENSFVTPSLTLPHRRGGAGWGHFHGSRVANRP